MNYFNNRHILLQKIARSCAIFLIFSIGISYTLFTRAEGIVFKVNVVADAQCFNGIDDDADGLIDALDTGCPDASDNQELDTTDNNSSSSGSGNTSNSQGANSNSDFPADSDITTPSEIPDTTDDSGPDVDFNSAPANPELDTVPVTPKKTSIKTNTPLNPYVDEKRENSNANNSQLPSHPLFENPPLFDVTSEFRDARMHANNVGFSWKVAPGDFLPISVKLINMGWGKRVDVQIVYSILSKNGDEVYSSSQTVAVETTASYIKMIQIPFGISSGIYTAKTSLVYAGQLVPATSDFPFTVEPKVLGIFKSHFIIIVSVIFITLILFICGFIVMRPRRLAKLTSINYHDIPHDMRTFYEIISDVIMDMRERVGDDALGIANSIDGLKIDVETGRVLSLSGNPSKIIATLVSEYEKVLGKKVSFSFRQKDQIE